MTKYFACRRILATSLFLFRERNARRSSWRRGERRTGLLSFPGTSARLERTNERTTRVRVRTRRVSGTSGAFTGLSNLSTSSSDAWGGARLDRIPPRCLSSPRAGCRQRPGPAPPRGCRRRRQSRSRPRCDRAATRGGAIEPAAFEAREPPSAKNNAPRVRARTGLQTPARTWPARVGARKASVPALPVRGASCVAHACAAHRWSVRVWRWCWSLPSHSASAQARFNGLVEERRGGRLIKL